LELLDVSLNWYRNDNNTFFGSDENGLLCGFNVVSGPEQTAPVDIRAQRASGWLPLFWGEYDVGASPDRRTQRFEMNVELGDGELFGQRFTEFISYESRQEYRRVITITSRTRSVSARNPTLAWRHHSRTTIRSFSAPIFFTAATTHSIQMLTACWPRTISAQSMAW